jgi:hypothetical protein
VCLAVHKLVSDANYDVLDGHGGELLRSKSLDSDTDQEEKRTKQSRTR